MAYYLVVSAWSVCFVLDEGGFGGLVATVSLAADPIVEDVAPEAPGLAEAEGGDESAVGHAVDLGFGEVQIICDLADAHDPVIGFEL